MARLAIFIVAVAWFGLRYLPPITERNVLVLVETKGLYMDALSNITGLKAAFQVRKNLDEYVLEDNKQEKIEKRVRKCNSSTCKHLENHVFFK